MTLQDWATLHRGTVLRATAFVETYLEYMEGKEESELLKRDRERLMDGVCACVKTWKD